MTKKKRIKIRKLLTEVKVNSDSNKDKKIEINKKNKC